MYTVLNVWTHSSEKCKASHGHCKQPGLESTRWWSIAFSQLQHDLTQSSWNLGAIPIEPLSSLVSNCTPFLPGLLVSGVHAAPTSPFPGRSQNPSTSVDEASAPSIPRAAGASEGTHGLQVGPMARNAAAGSRGLYGCGRAVVVWVCYKPVVR